MESQKNGDLKHMKIFLTLFLIFLCSISFGQDSLFLMNDPKFRNDKRSCEKAKNKRLFLDSLIALNEKALPVAFPEKIGVLDKLTLYNLQAGLLCGTQKKEALLYMDKAEKWADSLRKLPYISTQTQDALAVLNYFHVSACAEMSFKDTATFYACNCKPLFPELNAPKPDTVKTEDAPKQLIPPRDEHYGELYEGNRLRIKPHFVSDSASVAYFKKNQSYFMAKLVLSYDLEFLTELNYKGKDTVIVRIQLNKEGGATVRKCSVVWSSSSQQFNELMISIFARMEIPYLPNHPLDVYIPFVIGPQDDMYIPGNVSTAIQSDYIRLLYRTDVPRVLTK